MHDVTPVSTRRGLLGRGLALVAGTLGLGAAGAEASTGSSPRPTALVIHGRGFHLQSPVRAPGVPPVTGDRATVYGELLADLNGEANGHFTSAYLATNSPFAAAGSIEVHTFHLPDGTIHGLGASAGLTEAHFAVIGGTGKYTGVRGSYVAIQRSRELGGDGTAEFHLTLSAEGAFNGR